MKIYQSFAGVCLTALLSACGAGSSSADSATPITTTAAAILAADKSGALPALNRDATVLGVDVNGNGVRDDLDAYIAALPDTVLQKAALSQMAAAIGNALTTDTANLSSMLIASKQIAAAAACNHARYDSATASKKSAEIEKISVNTKTRFQAYDKFNAALSGTTFVRPQGDGCAN
ncbi:MAG: hypothetical protein ACOH2K_18050 [Burkholderiaceae bacterium]